MACVTSPLDDLRVGMGGPTFQALLHPERFPIRVLEERRLQQGNLIFGAQYQQNPIIAEGSQINLGWFGQCEKREQRSRHQKVVQS